MINSVYFGEQGLTSISANYIANKAKEYCQDIEQQLQNVEFFTTTINLIGDAQISTINNGVKSIDWIPTALETISKCNSLIAWLREAIKERESALNELRNFTIFKYAELNGIKLPNNPERESVLIEEEYYDSLPIKERNRYYSLEAQASVIGKYIHLNGSLNKARKKLSNKIQKPHEISGSGRDSIIYNYEPTISLNDVDNLFFELQNKHREIQSQLNAMKFECEKAIKESTIKSQQKYSKETEEYRQEILAITNKTQEYINEQTKIIGDLKIIIPDKLKDIYNEVSKLGK